jgi:hypothetical protein
MQQAEQIEVEEKSRKILETLSSYNQVLNRRRYQTLTT